MKKIKDIMCYFGFHEFKVFSRFRNGNFTERMVVEDCENCQKRRTKVYKLGKRKDC